MSISYACGYIQGSTQEQSDNRQFITILEILPFKTYLFSPSSDVIRSKVIRSSVIRSTAQSCAEDKSISLDAILSALGVSARPRSNHSLETFNTSHRLTTVSKEAPAIPRSMVDMNCVDKFSLSASCSCVRPDFSRETRMRFPIAMLNAFLDLILFSPKCIALSLHKILLDLNITTCL